MLYRLTTDSSGTEKKLAEIEMAKNKKVFPYCSLHVFNTFAHTDAEASQAAAHS